MPEQDESPATVQPTQHELMCLAVAVEQLRATEATLQRIGWHPEGALAFALGELLSELVLSTTAPGTAVYNTITNLPPRSA